MYGNKPAVDNRVSREVYRIRNTLDACSCAPRDKENRIINPELRKEEEKLDETLPRFVSEHAEEIIQQAAPAQVSHLEAKEISGRIEGLDAHVAAELLFAVLENPDSFAALTKSAFTDSLARLDDDVASAHLYEVRLTQNADALTDRRLFTEDAVSFFNAAGKESASEVYNSIGRTGNVGSIEGMFNVSVLETIGGDAKIAAELSYALGSTGSDAVLSSEVMGARKTMSAGLFANVLSAMWMTRKPEAFSDAETLDKIGKGKLELWEYAANLVSGRDGKTVVVAKLGDDEHDRGAKSVVQSLSDAGFRVIYVGNAETHGEIVRAALRYGAEAVGFSFSADSQQRIAAESISSLRSVGEQVSFFGGGAVTPYAARSLENAGVRFFQPSSSFSEAASFIRVHAAQQMSVPVISTSTERSNLDFTEVQTAIAFGGTRFGTAQREIAFSLTGGQAAVLLTRSSSLPEAQAAEETQGIVIGPYGQMDLGNGTIAVNPSGVPIPLSKAIIIMRLSQGRNAAKDHFSGSSGVSKSFVVPPPLRYPKAAISETALAHSSNPWQVMLMVHGIFPNEAKERSLSSIQRGANLRAQPIPAEFIKNPRKSADVPAPGYAWNSKPNSAPGIPTAIPILSQKANGFRNPRKGYKWANPQANQGEPMVNVEVIRVPPEVKIPSKFELRQQLMDGKTENENQRALTGIEKPLQSIKEEFAGSTKYGAISETASEVLGLIEGSKVAAQVRKYYSEDGGKGAKFIADIRSSIQNRTLERMVDEPLNGMVVENYMVRNKVEERKDTLGSLSAEGRRGQRVASIQERTPGSPVAGFKDVGATEEARNKDIWRELQSTADAYYALAAVTAGTKLTKDLMLVFESKQLKPEQKWSRAESLLEEFEKNPASYRSSWTLGGVGGAGSGPGTGTGAATKAASPATTASAATVTAARQKTKLKFASKDWTEHATEYIGLHDFAKDAILKSQDPFVRNAATRMMDAEQITYAEALSVWKVVMLAWKNQQSDDVKKLLPSDNDINSATQDDAHIVHRKAMHAHIANLPEEVRKVWLSDKSLRFLSSYAPLSAPNEWYDGNDSTWNRIHYDELWRNSKIAAGLRNRKEGKGTLPPASPTGTTEEETGAPPLSSP